MRKATIAAVLAVAALGGCKVQVKDGGELPKVDVQPGKMPDVHVSTDSVQMPNIKAPDIKAPDVHLPDVKAPDLHAPKVDLPGGDKHVQTDTTRRRP